MQREMPMFQQVGPRDASDKTLRLCDSEQDAIAVALQLSGLSQTEVARRMQVSEQLVSAWKLGQRPMVAKYVGPFCEATGSNLVRQYRTLQSAFRIAQGHPRYSDRIAAIASYSIGAAA